MYGILVVAAIAFLIVAIVSPIFEAVVDWIICHPKFDRRPKPGDKDY